MSKIARKNMTIFGINSGFEQVAQFGSLAAGSPMFSTDPNVIQSLSNYLTGWFDAVLGENSPAIEDMNALCYLFGYQLTYLFQAGVPEWLTTTIYYTGSLAQVSGVVYCSLVDNNTGNNPVGDHTNWRLVDGNIMSAVGDLIYGDTNGDATRLPIGTTGQQLEVVAGKPAWVTATHGALINLSVDTTFSANTVIKFDQTVEDTDSAYDSSTGLFTAVAAGRYQLDLTMNASVSISLYIKKNGSQFPSGKNLISIPSTGFGSGSIVLNLAIGDTVGIYTDTTAIVGQLYTNYSIYKISN